MMFAAEVIGGYNNVVFTVSYNSEEYRALQLVDRQDGKTYANTEIHIGDTVLVVEVPQFISPPKEAGPSGESISHVITGLLPPSNIHRINDDLVQVQS